MSERGSLREKLLLERIVGKTRIRRKQPLETEQKWKSSTTRWRENNEGDEILRKGKLKEKVRKGKKV